MLLSYIYKNQKVAFFALKFELRPNIITIILLIESMCLLSLGCDSMQESFLEHIHDLEKNFPF